MSPTLGLYDVLRRIRPVHDSCREIVTASLADHDLTMPMRAVLERLHDAGPQTVPDIARWLSVTRQGIQTLVDDAKRLGYVVAQPNPNHRRSHLIALTDQGSAAFTSLHRKELVTLGHLANGVSAADVAACIRVLDHLVDGLAALTDSPDQEKGQSHA